MNRKAAGIRCLYLWQGQGMFKRILQMLRRACHYAEVLGPRGLVGSVVAKTTNRRLLWSFRLSELKRPILLRLPSSDADAYEQIFLRHEYQLRVRVEPRVIIDAGANVGLASIYFTNQFPRARIFAIECESSNFEMLQQNVAYYENVVPIHAALWDREGEVSVNDPGNGEWGFMVSHTPGSSSAAQTVRALTLERIMREHSIAHIDILKVDIEGAELEVLNASAGWINHVDTIIIELHESLKVGCQASFDQATTSFKNRWHQGINACASRNHSSVIGRGERAGRGLLS